MTTANTATDFKTLITKANGDAWRRILNPETIEQEAVGAYAKGVEWCDKLGLPYSAIRVDVTGGERLANSYKYPTDMTSLTYDGAKWDAARIRNKAPMARGKVYLHIAMDSSEHKALAAKVKTAGLKSRKESVRVVAEDCSVSYHDALCIFAA